MAKLRQHSDDSVDESDEGREEFLADLNPDPTAGQNHGLNRAGEMAPSAYDVKDVHRTWSGLTAADLKQIPVIPEGTRLDQGAVYFDLNDPARGEFKALGNMEAGAQDRFVAKNAVDYQLWNALIGVDNPERLGLASES
jgi:hypothetical protein